MDNEPYRTRLTVYIPRVAHDEVKRLAHMFGVTHSQLANVCMTIGMNTLLRAVEPEKVLEPQIWEQLMRIAKKIEGEGDIA
jgi:hypothetical protein